WRRHPRINAAAFVMVSFARWRARKIKMRGVPDVSWRAILAALPCASPFRVGLVGEIKDCARADVGRWGFEVRRPFLCRLTGIEFRRLPRPGVEGGKAFR